MLNKTVTASDYSMPRERTDCSCR